MSKDAMPAEQARFIEDFALLLVQWNMPITAARLYAYLYLRTEPVSLDQIAADLEISKSNASTAARMLESHGNARRVTERGTKRISYLPSDDPGAPLRKHTELLGSMARMIEERKAGIAAGEARAQLERLARFHADLQRAMETVVLKPNGA